MEQIVIYPKDQEQFNAIKEFLVASKMDFDILPDELPQHVLDGIERSIQQHQNGQTISFEEFKAKHFLNK